MFFFKCKKYGAGAHFLTSNTLLQPSIDLETRLPILPACLVYGSEGQLYSN